MKNDWLKAIVGDSYTDEMDQKVATHLGQNFVSKGEFNSKNEELKTEQGKVATLNGQLEELKKVDPKELQETITKLQGDNAKLAEDGEKNLAEARRDFKLETTLMSKYHAKNPKAVMGMLDRSKVSLDGDNLIGLDEQLQPILKSDAYLFGQESTQRTSVPHGRAPSGADGSGESSGNAKDGDEIDGYMNDLLRGKSQTGDEE